MWNGIWKLTAMVGVIGVGLFAAYQAQKGMNFTVASAPSDAVPDDANSDPTIASIEEVQSNDSASDDQSPFADTENSEPPVRNAQRRRLPVSEPDDDSFSDSSPKQSLTAKATASNNSGRRPLSAKRGGEADFSQNDEAAESKSTENSRETVQLIEDDASEKQDRRQPIRQVNASSTGDASLATETETNPFPDETPKATGRKASTSDEISTNEELSEMPGKARISTDFDSDPPPIQSKRAKQKSEKRISPAGDAESNPFGDDPSATTSQPSKAKSSVSLDSIQVSEPSEKSNEPIGSEPLSGRDSAPLAAPQSLPLESPSSLGNDSTLTGTKPLRVRSTAPATLPEDSNSDPLADPFPQKREPAPRRQEYDRVTPVDMVGDGIVGDASQRGLQQPRLTIEKVAQQQAVLDQPLIYTIIVKNTGSVDAHNVVIEDRIPKGTELVGTSPQAELSGKRLIWNQLLLKPNEEKKISIKVVPKQEGPIGSVARVYFATEVSAEIVVAAPQLEFTVKTPSEVRLGQRFDLIFNLKNVGKVDANNIIVRDIVPDELKNEAGADIECPVGKLAPDEVREIVLSVTASKTGTVVNRATLTADSGIKKTLDSNIDVIGEVLVLTRSGQNRLYVERPVVFTNNIRNDGNQRADRVKIAEVVPAGMEFETASDGGKYDSNLRAVVWTVGPLAPGNDKSVTVKYVPKETGTHAAKITATGSAGSTAAVNSSVDVVGKPELQMETLSATGVVTLGDRITSKFQLNNTGTAAAMNVQLRVRLPRELRLISVKGAKFQQQGDDIVFDPISELAPRTKSAYELVLEPIAEADAQIALEISADHLTKPGRRVETIQIARDALK